MKKHKVKNIEKTSSLDKEIKSDIKNIITAVILTGICGLGFLIPNLPNDLKSCLNITLAISMPCFGIFGFESILDLVESIKNKKSTQKTTNQTAEKEM